jgi:hypothetical protein
MLTLPVTASIPATASRAERTATYTANTEPDTPHDGTLVVVEWGGKKIPRTITSTYLVREVPPVGRGRRFEIVLLKSEGASPSRQQAAQQRVGSLYTTDVRPDGSGYCTCPAGEVGRTGCVHLAAMSELIATGGIESPFEFGEPERYEWETEYANTNQGE